MLERQLLVDIGWEAANNAYVTDMELRAAEKELEGIRAAQDLPGVSIHPDAVTQLTARRDTLKTTLGQHLDIAGKVMLDPDSPFLEVTKDGEAETPLSSGATLRLTAEIVVPPEEVVEKAKQLREGVGEIIGSLATESRIHVEIGADELTPEEMEHEKILSIEIDELFRLLGKNNSRTASRALNVMNRNELRTFRDMLLFGQDAMADERNAGSTVMDFLRQVVVLSDGNVTWKDKPTPTDYAEICPTLRHVPAKLFIEDYYHRKTLKDHSAAEMLTLSPEDLSTLLVTDHHPIRNVSAATQILDKIRSFSADFLHARMVIKSTRQ